MTDLAIINGEWHITDLMVEGLSGSCPIVGEPAIPHRALCVLIFYFQLLEVEIHLFRWGRITLATLQPVEGDRDGFGDVGTRHLQGG